MYKTDLHLGYVIRSLFGISEATMGNTVFYFSGKFSSLDDKKNNGLRLVQRIFFWLEKCPKPPYSEEKQSETHHI
jgi:hypothetical protein